MPNYVVVNNAQFNPFTYQELTAPLDRMEAYHEKLAQEYDNLSSQADILEAMGNDDRDKNSGVYGRYKAYSDSLRKEADNLYRYGLNVESRRRLSDLRRRYNTEIVPIQNAWNKREEEAKAQQAAMLSNPMIRFSRKAADTPLESYINNPQGGYDVVNLENVYKQMSGMAKNLSKLKREGKLEAIDPYTNMLVTDYGIDPNLLYDWQADPSKSPVLTSMMQKAFEASGLNSEAFKSNPDIMREALGMAQMGAWEAVGESKQQAVENYGSRLGAQMQKELAVAQAKTALSSGSGSNGYTFSDSIYELPMQGTGKEGNATTLPVRALNYEKGDWNPNSKNYTAREITGYKEGKPVYDSKQITLGDLLNKKNSDKNNINISSYWSDEPGQEGLILATTEDGKAHRYFISADTMPENNIQAAKTYFQWAKLYKEAGKNEEARQALQIAMQALHTGLTVHNSNYTQNLVRQPSLKQQGQVD